MSIMRDHDADYLEKVVQMSKGDCDSTNSSSLRI